MSPLTLMWDVTPLCNLRCAHCFFEHWDAKRLKSHERLHIVEECVNGGVRTFSLLGGEPLIVSSEILEWAQRFNDIEFNIVTNGILLGRDNVRKLAERNKTSFVVSLDGWDEESYREMRGTNVFGTIVKNIEKLIDFRERKSLGFKFTVNTVLTKANYKRIERILEICYNLGVDKWRLLNFAFYENLGQSESMTLSPDETLGVLLNVGRWYKNKNDSRMKLEVQHSFPLISRYLKLKLKDYPVPDYKMSCSAAQNLGYIDPEGRLFPCERVARKKFRRSFEINTGLANNNLLETDFTSIWNNEYFSDFFRLIHNEEHYIDIYPCDRCPYREAGQCTPCPLEGITQEPAIHHLCKLAYEEMEREGNLPRWTEIKEDDDRRGIASKSSTDIGITRIPEEVRFHPEVRLGLNPHFATVSRPDNHALVRFDKTGVLVLTLLKQERTITEVKRLIHNAVLECGLSEEVAPGWDRIVDELVTTLLKQKMLLTVSEPPFNIPPIIVPPPELES